MDRRLSRRTTTIHRCAHADSSLARDPAGTRTGRTRRASSSRARRARRSARASTCCGRCRCCSSRCSPSSRGPPSSTSGAQIRPSPSRFPSSSWLTSGARAGSQAAFCEKASTRPRTLERGARNVVVVVQRTRPKRGLEVIIAVAVPPGTTTACSVRARSRGCSAARSTCTASSFSRRASRRATASSRWRRRASRPTSA